MTDDEALIRERMGAALFEMVQRTIILTARTATADRVDEIYSIVIGKMADKIRSDLH